MIALFLATFFSASIALILKYGEARRMNRFAVLSANYLLACLLSASIMLGQAKPIPNGTLSAAALSEVGNAMLEPSLVLSPAASLTWALLVGLVAGCFFFLGFFFYQRSVYDRGVTLAGAFAKLGILVPMGLSLLLWKDLPTGLQWLGIGLAMVSIAIANWPSRSDLEQGKTVFAASLILLFFFGGLAEFSTKLFQKYGLDEHKTPFLLLTFLVAFFLSLIALYRQGQPVQKRDWITGLVVGVPNFFCAFFLIKALGAMSAAVVFPAYAAGSIVIIHLFGTFLFKEKSTKVESFAIGLTIVALVLINI